MKRQDVERFFARLAEQRPEPRGELDYTNPFTLLVAVVLSAQATDVGVNKATKGLFAAADTPEKMLALGEAGVKAHIKTIGLFNAKGAGPHAAGGGAEAGKGGVPALQAARPSLADPARTVCLQGAAARLPGLRRGGPLCL